MKVLKQFWEDAVCTTFFLINRMTSTMVIGNVPYGVLFPNKPLFPVEFKVLAAHVMSEMFDHKLPSWIRSH